MNNHARMLRLAEEVFAAHDDPTQLQVDPEVLEHLADLHPAAVSEVADEHGPIAWVLLIPTTTDLMDDFLTGQLTEQDLYRRTPTGAAYEAVYLCSAMVLEEHRRKGIAKRMTLDALAWLLKEHPIRALFCWPFTEEGSAFAQALAADLDLPLRMRTM
jgi:GNAT superfamily N-acetyltransferase